MGQRDGVFGEGVGVEGEVLPEVVAPVPAVVLAGADPPLVGPALVDERLMEQLGAGLPGVVAPDVDPQAGRAGEGAVFDERDGVAVGEAGAAAEVGGGGFFGPDGGAVGAGDA